MNWEDKAMYGILIAMIISILLGIFNIYFN